MFFITYFPESEFHQPCHQCKVDCDNVATQGQVAEVLQKLSLVFHIFILCVKHTERHFVWAALQCVEHMAQRHLIHVFCILVESGDSNYRSRHPS